MNQRCRQLSTSPSLKVITTFHKRPLPETLISLSSKNGKEIFQEALAGGGMDSYFALAEQFVTQSEPSYCALSSLAMVLNALNFDPKKVWKGAWRWVSEETLQCETQFCGHSLDKVKRDGMDFDEFESLARCHGIRIRAKKNNNKNHSEICSRDITQFRSYVETVCSSDKSESFIIANFSRKVLGQTGIGHFSPIGGYHKEKDLVLIMDVARFKYPPFWVPLEQLWAAMAVEDEKTKTPRGYFILSTWNSVAAADLFSALIHNENDHNNGHKNDDNNVVHIVHTDINKNINEINNKINHNHKISDCNHNHDHDHNHSHTNNHSNHSHSHAIISPITPIIINGDCPPLIRTWDEFKKQSKYDNNDQKTCSECHTKPTN